VEENIHQNDLECSSSDPMLVGFIIFIK